MRIHVTYPLLTVSIRHTKDAAFGRFTPKTTKCLGLLRNLHEARIAAILDQTVRQMFEFDQSPQPAFGHINDGYVQKESGWC